MTAFTTYTNGKTIAATHSGNAAGVPAVDILQGEYDAALRNAEAADTIAVLHIPANTIVHSVFYEVLNGEANQTMSVGDGDGTASYFSAVNVATKGNAGATVPVESSDALVGYSGGKFYSAADTIDILVPADKAYTTLKVRVCAKVTKFGKVA